MNFVETKDRYKKSVEDRLASLVSGNLHPPKIYEAMSYSLLGGGKRLRPTLLLAAYESVSYPTGDTATSNHLAEKVRAACALDFACALEMIHTYSLVHDDLPALDNDNMRRGRPTNHIVFGEAMAILAGDALLNKSYELMIDTSAKYQYIRCLPALVEISRAAGINGMIGGQVMDINTAGQDIDDETLLYIHNHKTAALIQAAITAGAIIGGASGRALDKFKLAGHHMGLGFQIMDDILDVIGDESSVGKPIGSDAKNNKNTYVSVFGIERATVDYHNMWDNCVQIFDDLGASFLSEYAKELRSRIN